MSAFRGSAKVTFATSRLIRKIKFKKIERDPSGNQMLMAIRCTRCTRGTRGTRGTRVGCKSRFRLLDSAFLTLFTLQLFLTVAEVAIPVKDPNLLLALYRIIRV